MKSVEHQARQSLELMFAGLCRIVGMVCRLSAKAPGHVLPDANNLLTTLSPCSDLLQGFAFLLLSGCDFWAICIAASKVCFFFFSARTTRSLCRPLADGDLRPTCGQRSEVTVVPDSMVVPEAWRVSQPEPTLWSELAARSLRWRTPGLGM